MVRDPQLDRAEPTYLTQENTSQIDLRLSWQVMILFVRHSCPLSSFILLRNIFSSIFSVFIKPVQSVQSLSHVWLFVTPWTAACQAITNSWSLLKLTPIELVMPSNHLILCCLLLLLPQSFSASEHWGLFQWVGSSHQVAKVLELQHQFFHWIFRVDFL